MITRSQQQIAMHILAAITPHIDMIRTETPHDWDTAYTLTKGPMDLNTALNMFSTRDPRVMSTCELAEQMKIVIFILPEEHSKFSVE